MEKGICKYPLVACRREANERSEMVTQLLYGETYGIIKESGDWLRIKQDREGYEAWIDSKLHSPQNGEKSSSVASEPFTLINIDGKDIPVPGASFAGLPQQVLEMW